MCEARKREPGVIGTNLMTAREFLQEYEPQTLGLLYDPSTAFQQDTETARRIAAELGAYYEGAKFPVWVWHLVYP